jgi:hypothetical protein
MPGGALVKENPNTLNVSKGSRTSSKKGKGGIFESINEALNHSQSKV